MNNNKPKVIFVLGGPGSGKGTQCARLVSEYGFIHLSAGELLRIERDSGSHNGDLINELMKEGKIVPSEITVELLKNAMLKNGWGENKFLIDGFPRNKENFTSWETLMEKDIDFRFVLFLDCQEQTMIDRILLRSKESGRVDDNIDSLRKRFQTFSSETKAIIDHYLQLNKVITINGEEDSESVFANIKKNCENLI